MSDLLERLRGRGWRMTAQRRVVAEVLNGEHVHLTADEVHHRAVAKLPEISRATVYNTLGELVSLGEVLEVTTDKRAKRYDPNAHVPHHHLVCTRCGTIVDSQIMSRSKCPKCQVELRSCIQCVNFDPGASFECAIKLTARVSPKDVANECPHFSGRTTWERETTAAANSGNNPKEPSGAKKAFDDLFKF